MSDTRSDIDVPASTLLNSDAVDRAPMASEQAVEREPSARDRVMARAVAKREAELAGEVQSWDENSSGTLESQMAEQSANRKPAFYEQEEDRVYFGPYADPEEPEAISPVESKPAPEAARTQQPVHQVQQPDAPSRFPVNFQGQVLHVTQDELLRLAEMGAIANHTVNEYNQQVQQQPASPPPPRRQTVDEARAREISRAIQFGDEATSAAAILGLYNDVAPQAPHIDVAAIKRETLMEMRREAQLAADTNVIKAEYADVLADPIRADAAARQVAAIRQYVVAAGIQASDLEIYREAGNRVRASFGTAPSQPGNQSQPPAPAGRTAPQAPNVISIRRSAEEIDARKRAAPQRTATVVDRRSAAPEAPRQPTGSDLVEKMRQQRGQSSMR